MRRIALTALAGLALTAGSASAQTVPPTTTQTPTTTTPTPEPAPKPKATFSKLSNETTKSRWAYTNLTLKIRKSHSSRSRSLGKLRFNTEDGLPEIYLALQLYTSPEGEEWVQIRIPGRPNGRVGWVPREGLGEFKVVRTQLVIERRKLRITLYKSGRRIFSAPIGIGKASTPTPGGKFWIREKLKGFGNPVYGPLAFGTAAYSKISDWPGGGVVGIHGTNQPQLIPGKPSHGCVRLKNSAILSLARKLPLGTPLLIK
jgi:lipoprotein-anchoring transpeptidase ErfK/SrfK